MSDNVIRPPMWQRKEDDDGDRVIFLTRNIQRLFTDHIDPPVTQLATLLLMQRTLLHQIQHCGNTATAREAMRQARELSEQYHVILDDGTKV